MGLYEPDLATVWNDPRIPTLPAAGIALYLLLVSKSWAHELPDDDVLVQANARAVMDGEEFARLWPAVKAMFTSKGGKLQLAWLESLRERRREYLLARARCGKQGGRGRTAGRGKAAVKLELSPPSSPSDVPPSALPPLNSPSSPSEPGAPSAPSSDDSGSPGMRVVKAQEWWCKEFERHCKLAYVPVKGRDAGILKRLLEGVTNEEFKRRASAVLDPRTRPKWISGNPSIVALQSAFNDVHAPKPAPAAESVLPSDALLVERAWTEKHRVLIDVEGLNGAKIRAPGLDQKYPGYDAACRELKLNGSATK